MMGKNKNILFLGSFIFAFMAFFIFNACKSLALTVNFDYSTNGGTSIEMNGANTEYTENDSVELTPVASKENWEFLGWSLTSEGKTPLTTLEMPNNDVTLYAIYKQEKTYTAIFNSGYAGVTKTEESCTTAIYNNETSGSCTVTTPSITPVENFETIGFGLNKDDSSTFVIRENETLTLSSSVTYEAIIEREFSINFVLNNAASIPASVTGNSCVVNSLDDTCIIQSYNILPKDGYEVKGWNINQTDTTGSWSTLSNRVFTGRTLVAYDNTYYAITSPSTYYITYQRNTGSFTTTYDETFDVEHPIKLSGISKYGYEFLGWKPTVNTGNWSTSELFLDQIPAGKYGSITLSAILTPVDVTVNFDYNGANDGNSISSKVIPFNTEIGSLPTPIKNGFIFEGWYLDETWHSVVDETIHLNWTSEETTIHAKWDLESITLDTLMDVTGTYGENAVELVANATHDSNLPLVYTWYKYNESTEHFDKIQGINSSVLTLKSVNDSSRYYVVVSLLTEGLSTSQTSNSATVTINPKKINITNLVPVDKVANGTLIGTVIGGNIIGAIQGDDLSFEILPLTLPSVEPGAYELTPNILLKGNSSSNYQIETIGSIIYNIKSPKIVSANEKVTFVAEQGFKTSFNLTVSDNTNNLKDYNIKKEYSENFMVRKIYEVGLVEGEKVIDYGEVKIKVALSKKLQTSSKYKILILDDENTLIDCKEEKGYLVFTADSNITFAILSNEYQRTTEIIILSILFVILLISLIVVIIKIKITNKTIDKPEIKKETKSKKQKNVKEEKEPIKKSSIHEKYLKLHEEKKETTRKKKLEDNLKNKKKPVKKA